MAKQFTFIKHLDGKAPYKVKGDTIQVADFVKEHFDEEEIGDYIDSFFDGYDLDLVQDENGVKYLAEKFWLLGEHENDYAFWCEIKNQF